MIRSFFLIIAQSNNFSSEFFENIQCNEIFSLKNYSFKENLEYFVYNLNIFNSLIQNHTMIKSFCSILEANLNVIEKVQEGDVICKLNKIIFATFLYLFLIQFYLILIQKLLIVLSIIIMQS